MAPSIKHTKPSGSQHFYNMAGSDDKTLKLYEGAFHDPLNDIDREVVMADIKGWINARLAAPLGNQARTQAASL
jgi:acylglycerol lipase